MADIVFDLGYCCGQLFSSALFAKDNTPLTVIMVTSFKVNDPLSLLALAFPLYRLTSFYFESPKFPTKSFSYNAKTMLTFSAILLALISFCDCYREARTITSIDNSRL